MKQVAFKFEETLSRTILIDVPDEINLEPDDYKELAEVAQLFYDVGLVKLDHDNLVGTSVAVSTPRELNDDD